MEALRTINRQDHMTVLCNLHHVDAARAYCDRIIGMTHGQITFDGPPESLTLEQLRVIYALKDDDEEVAQALTQGRSGLLADNVGV
jgi:phosphonate transport system ATP-binding protein